MAKQDVIGCVENGIWRTTAPNPHIDLDGTFPAGMTIRRTFVAALSNGDEVTATVYDPLDPDVFATYSGVVFTTGTPNILDFTAASLIASKGTLSADQAVAAFAVDPVLEAPDDATPKVRQSGEWIDAAVPGIVTRTIGAAGDFTTFAAAMAWYATLPAGGADNSSVTVAVELQILTGETATVTDTAAIKSGPTLRIKPQSGSATLQLNLSANQNAFHTQDAVLMFEGLTITTVDASSRLAYLYGGLISLINCTSTGFTGTLLAMSGGDVDISGTNNLSGIINVTRGSMVAQGIFTAPGSACFSLLDSIAELIDGTLQNSTTGIYAQQSKVRLRNAWTLDTLTNGIQALDGSQIVLQTVPTITAVTTPYSPALNILDGEGSYITDGNLTAGNWADGSKILHWINDTQALGNVTGITAVPATSGQVVTATMTGDTTFNVTKTLGTGEALQMTLYIENPGGAWTMAFQFNGLAVPTPDGFTSDGIEYLVAFFADEATAAFSERKIQ